MPHFSSVVVCHNYTVSVNLALMKLNLNHYFCVMTYCCIGNFEENMDKYRIHLAVTEEDYVVLSTTMRQSALVGLPSSPNNSAGGTRGRGTLHRWHMPATPPPSNFCQHRAEQRKKTIY
jgi:hypothetical protein